MSIIRNSRFKFNARKRMGEVGDRPGTIRISEDALAPKLTVYSYNQAELVTSEGDDLGVLLEQFKICTDHSHWVQVNGLGDKTLIEALGDHLQINPLVLEDISSTHQRPKFEEYDDYAFAVSRVIRVNKDDENREVSNTQFSAIIKANIIVSFEEDYEKRFEPVVNRLKAGKGSIRTAGPGYMLYALTDTIIDQYFVILASIGDALDGLEDKVYDKADKSIMYSAQHLKRSLIMMRRVSWPERDKVNDMIRSDTPLIDKETRNYLRDAYDHCIQIMDLIESYKEITSSVIDLYLAMVSNRMNEIMKVLTIISVIFIPLTFIAGVYGMNFQREDPHGRVIPDNMPELYWHHGYLYSLALMLLIAIVQVFIFWRKGWFHRL